MIDKVLNEASLYVRVRCGAFLPMLIGGKTSSCVCINAVYDSTNSVSRYGHIVYKFVKALELSDLIHG